MSSQQVYTPVAIHSYPDDSSYHGGLPNAKDIYAHTHTTKARKGGFFAAIGSPRFYWPLMVILGQTAFLILGWTFFIVTGSRPVPFDDWRATNLRDATQGITMIVTFIATLISTATGFLFSHAVRHALTVVLSSPTNKTSLFVVSNAIKISKKSLIMGFVRFKWTLLGLIMFMVHRFQTASWNTLLTPRRIELATQMSGFELDFTNRDLLAALDSQLVNFFTQVAPDLRVNTISQVISSGVAAANAELGRPSLLSFDSYSYIGRGTHGIMPANYLPLESAIQLSTTSNTTYPANTRLPKLKFDPEGYPHRYIMGQQGISANIICETKAPQSGFNLSIVDEPLPSSQNLNASFIRSSLRCPGSETTTEYPPVLVTGGNYLFATPCFITEAQSTPESLRRGYFELVIQGGGIYRSEIPTVCTVRPLVTTLNVEYNENSLFSSLSSQSDEYPNYINATSPFTSVEVADLGFYPVAVIERAFIAAQSMTGNVIGNSMTTLGNANMTENEVNVILANFLNGMFEFSGTLMRSSLTSSDSFLRTADTNEIPPSMTRSTNGTFYVQTLGWHLGRNVSPATMISPSIILLGSIFCVLYALAKGSSDDDDVDFQSHFDAGDILQVIAATANGDLRTAPLAAFDEKSAIPATSINVRLRATAGGDKVGLFTA